MTRLNELDTGNAHHQLADLTARLQLLESVIAGRATQPKEGLSVEIPLTFRAEDNEFDPFESESAGEARLDSGLKSWEISWKDRRTAAVSFTNEKAILHSNGDALHSLHIHNHSDIHNKQIRGFIKVFRNSTNAEVFRFGYIYAFHHTNKGGDHVVNQYYDDVKKHWDDIVRGNMRYEANWQITSIHS